MEQLGLRTASWRPPISGGILRQRCRRRSPDRKLIGWKPGARKNWPIPSCCRHRTFCHQAGDGLTNWNGDLTSLACSNRTFDLALVINSLDGGGAEKQLWRRAGAGSGGIPLCDFHAAGPHRHIRVWRRSLVRRKHGEAGVEFHEAAPGIFAWWRRRLPAPRLAWALGGYRFSVTGAIARTCWLGLRASFVPFRHIGSLRDADEGSIWWCRLLWRLILSFADGLRQQQPPECGAD